MADFFWAGGAPMYPTLLFGFMAFACAVLQLLRPEARYTALVWSLGLTTLASGLLGFSLGLMNTFRYLERVPPADQLKIAALGCEESLHNVVLTLILLMLTTLVMSVASFRASRVAA